MVNRRRSVKMRHVVRRKNNNNKVGRLIDQEEGETAKSVSTTKLKLNTVLNQNYLEKELPKEELLDLFEQCVEFSSHIWIRGLKFLQRLLIKYCLNPDGYSDDNITGLLQDQKFYRQCLHAFYFEKSRGGPKEKPSLLVSTTRVHHYPAPEEGEDEDEVVGFYNLVNGETDKVYSGLPGTILDYKARELQTVTLNHFTLNFFTYQRLNVKAFLCRLRGRAESSLVNLICDKINGKDVDLETEASEIINNFRVHSRAIIDFIDAHRGYLGFACIGEEEDEGTDVVPNGEVYITVRPATDDAPRYDDNTAWIKRHLGRVVRYFYSMANYNENNHGKKLRLCPIPKLKIHHLQIDSRMLEYALRGVGYITSSDKFDKVKMWKRFFDYEPYEKDTPTVSREFDLSVKTDGISASLIFAKKILLSGGSAVSTVPRGIEKFRQYYNAPENNGDNDNNIHQLYNVMGMDPGIVNIYAGYHQNADGSGTFTSLSLSGWRESSGINRNIRRSNKLNRNNATLREYREASSAQPILSVNLDSVIQHDDRFYSTPDTPDGHEMSLYSRLMLEKAKRIHRNKAFRAWKKRKSAMMKVVASLDIYRGNGKKLLVLFEDGSFGNNYRGNAPAPILWFKKECMRQHIVISVPRWMTSQTCPVCFSRFPQTYKAQADYDDDDDNNDDEWYKRYVRGLICCQSKTCRSSCYIDRDKSASLVVFYVGTTEEDDLPDILRQDRKDSRPPRPNHHILRV